MCFDVFHWSEVGVKRREKLLKASALGLSRCGDLLLIA
jgi:hypothetical protein